MKVDVPKVRPQGALFSNAGFLAAIRAPQYPEHAAMLE